MSAAIRKGLLALALCLAVLGCESGPGMTRPNYNRIATDGSMTKEDVDKLLGSPGHVYRGKTGEQIANVFGQVGKGIGREAPPAPRPGSGTEYRWGGDYRFIICKVVNGKVVDRRQQGW